MSSLTRLVAAAASGDRDALSMLLVQHRSMAMATCCRMLGDPMLAEEAFQEASLTVLLNLDLLQQPDRFGAWFTGIALNVCRRALRERRREHLVAEALSIAMQMEKIASSRPMTAALAAGLVSAAGGRIREVRMERLADSVYYAVVVVDSAAGSREVDARPSDAINLALLTGSPILVGTEVLRQAEAARAATEQLAYDEVAEAAELGAEALAQLSRSRRPT
jgi:bifunctional DNase/RNase